MTIQLADQLMTVEEAAGHLKVGRSTTFRLLQSGQLPSVKIGGSRRVRRSDLEAYVANLPTNGRKAPRPARPTHPDNPGVPDGGGGNSGTGPGREAA